MTTEEAKDLAARSKVCGVTRSSFIRKAIRKSQLHPIVHVNRISPELLSVMNDLITEGKRIGNNLNQIARALNTTSSADPVMMENLRQALGDLSEWKYAILQKAGKMIGDTETYKF